MLHRRHPVPGGEDGRDDEPSALEKLLADEEEDTPPPSLNTSTLSKSQSVPSFAERRSLAVGQPGIMRTQTSPSSSAWERPSVSSPGILRATSSPLSQADRASMVSPANQRPRSG